MWFHNGMPADARPVTGYLIEIGGDKLAIGGTAQAQGRLLFSRDGEGLEGRQQVPAKTWNHLVLVCEKNRVSVYLNGRATAEIAGIVSSLRRNGELFVGGQGGKGDSFEGKIDEVAVYGRALRLEEVSSHYRLASGRSK
jgi:hypothetical protein